MAKKNDDPIDDADGGMNIYRRSVHKLTPKEFIHRFQIPICIVFGMIGFYYSVKVITYKDDSGSCPYGEIIIKNKAAIVDTVLNHRIARLKEIIKQAPAKTATDAEKAEFAWWRVASQNALRQDRRSCQATVRASTPAIFG